jgi:glycosyltransferase involved in cell wall biosynthesis
MYMVELMAIFLFILLILGACFIAFRLHFATVHFKMNKLLSGPKMLSDMPSVSVCIPARNETHAMTEALERVIASGYPKLEIIVLDDSSGDDTSVLIKSFAHAGVRFVEGSPLPTGWLGKNHALEGLLHEASGSLILYLDVDTHSAPDTIEQLVAYSLQEKAAMISVLPRRNDAWRASTLFGTLRYYWEIILHRSSSPAVASSAWMIDRVFLLDELGGFEPLKSVMQPEAKIAAQLSARQLYRFLIGTPLLGIAYEKKWRSQVDTSIRLLYPVLGGHFFETSVIALYLALVAAIPFIIIISIVLGLNFIALLSTIALSVYMTLYGLYLASIERRTWLFGMLLWPAVVFQELLILIISMYKHMTHRVTWKDRPISS